jgi:excisionase family DNA binding protein
LQSRKCARAKLLSTGRVATLCGFSTSAVLQWIRSGKLAAYTSPGGQHRVRPEELLRFLRQHGMHVPPELAPAGPYRVLIVDDEAVVRDVLRRMLWESPLDCTVEMAENGVVGCMKLPVCRPHLVVLDIVMPEIDGVELCRTIKASEELAGTKVLLITGYQSDDRLARGLEAGADGWLAKPILLEPFLTQVAELLGLQPAEVLPRPRQAPGAEGVAATAAPS